MKLAAYVRVSTDKQAEEGYGLDAQRSAIQAWAKARGHKLALWASDEGVSGANGLETREGLAIALAALQARTVAGMVVFKLDRLARDVVLQERLLADLQAMGARLFSTIPSEDDLLDLSKEAEDPSRRMIRVILGAVADYEKAMIRMRLRMGKAAKLAKGGYVGGAPPFGFRAESGALVEDAEEHAAAQRIVALRAEGKTLRAICEALADEGYSTKRGGRWHPHTVSQVLLRTTRESAR